MRVKQILRDKDNTIRSIESDATVKDAIVKLCQHNIGSLMVLENGRPLGIITERDVLRETGRDVNTMPSRLVSQVMTQDLICATEQDTVEYVMSIMTKNKIRHLPVVEDGQIIGLLSIGDVIKSLLDDVATENKYLRDYITQSI